MSKETVTGPSLSALSTDSDKKQHIPTVWTQGGNALPEPCQVG